MNIIRRHLKKMGKLIEERGRLLDKRQEVLARGDKALGKEPRPTPYKKGGKHD